MSRIKLLFFLVSFVSVAYADDSEIGIKRSAICLIDRVAKFNNITAEYMKINSEQRNGTTHVECKLDLEKEHYFSNSTSFSKAKEKVARQAYALTQYQKPPLENRTCVAIKSEISLLEEYAHLIKKNVLYHEGQRNLNGTFTFTATLDGKTATGSGYKKKSAKQSAASQLLQVIERFNVIDTLVAKYNQTKFHDMDPILRIRKIVHVTDPTGDGIYTKVDETQGANGQDRRVTVQVLANDYKANGSGASFQEAKRNAATNLLRSMKFLVTYH